MTPEQIEVAARKLCELLQYPATDTEIKLSRHEIERRLKRAPDEIDQAIKYALEQK